jgi:hypothetical protein
MKKKSFIFSQGEESSNIGWYFTFGSGSAIALVVCIATDKARLNMHTRHNELIERRASEFIWPPFL